ncbi:hypothetical protein CDAR_442661 [Caerostris darwini]|uniref:Uncharacterized protein n=1 Tax=Caerostris darwini TaxID=1538125 RepID=A0AAV4VND4_9ARAC|nr:hypothetical protein CDAR_442661 [Caerostris darwini]
MLAVQLGKVAIRRAPKKTKFAPTQLTPGSELPQRTSRPIRRKSISSARSDLRDRTASLARVLSGSVARRTRITLQSKTGSVNRLPSVEDHIFLYCRYLHELQTAEIFQSQNHKLTE